MQHIKSIAITIIICITVSYNIYGSELPYKISFRSFNAAEKIPSNSINCIFQDHIGFLWIGTEQGLYRYNGHTVQLYKNDKEQPHLLTSNNILCLANDSDYLWIGTDRGINRMHLATGQYQSYHLTDFSNTDHISVMTITSNGVLWVGTKGGLYRYDTSTDTFILYCDQRGNSKVPHCSITTIIEDSQGYLWIGTWDKGLYRYSSTGEFYELPRFNDINSAHVVFEDNMKNLWVGTWGKGLYHIYNPYSTNEPLKFKNYMCEQHPTMPSNYIYSITTDPYTRTLWIGTSKGLFFCSNEYDKDTFYTLPEPNNPLYNVFGRGVSHMICDRDGHIWFNASLYGIISASTRPRELVSHQLPEPYRDSYNISAIAYDKHNALWIGIDNKGLIKTYDNNKKIIEMTPLLGEPIHSGAFKINTIYPLAGDGMAFGTERDGLIITDSYNKKVSYNKQNSPWLQDNCIYSIYEDGERNLLLGTWMGLSILYHNGKGLHLTNERISELLDDARIAHITPAGTDCYWLSTRNKGIIRLCGDLHNPASLQATLYDKPIETELPVTDVYKIVVDHARRVWACSEAGLMLYEPKHDGFSIVNHRFGIPYDDIYSIEESNDSSLWISSQHAIINLRLTEEGEMSHLRLYTRKDGIDNYSFNKRFSDIASDGSLCFASFASYTTITNDTTRRESNNSQAYISDIRLSNTPIRELHKQSKKPFTDALPPYTHKLILNNEYRHLDFEFSSFNYDELSDESFTYLLDGYDKEWRYTESGNNSAHYNNIPWGHYTLRLRAMNTDGSWSQHEQILQIHIKCPIHMRWYAIIVYVVLMICILIFIAKHLQSRTKSRHEIQLAHMEKEKIEELNHNKLRFFTNITHDLMTPLTVILATINKLEQESPEHNDDYKIIQNNLNRQMRLLQQILEFRKAETGNLNLQVSLGDIADFCRREIESIQPLMRKKELHLSLGNFYKLNDLQIRKLFSIFTNKI